MRKVFERTDHGLETGPAGDPVGRPRFFIFAREF